MPRPIYRTCRTCRTPDQTSQRREEFSGAVLCASCHVDAKGTQRAQEAQGSRCDTLLDLVRLSPACVRVLEAQR